MRIIPLRGSGMKRYDISSEAPLRLLFIFLPAILCAQTPTSPNYTAPRVFSASSGEVVTVQIPANSPKAVVGGNISGSVSAASTICFSWNGSTATSTPIVISPAPGSPFGIAKAFYASNSTGGVAGSCFVLSSGPFNFTGGPNFYLWKAGTAPPGSGTNPSSAVQNFTVTLTPSTGTINGNLNVNWGEQ